VKESVNCFFRPKSQYNAKIILMIINIGTVKLKTDNLGDNSGEIYGTAKPINSNITKILLIKNTSLFMKDNFFKYYLFSINFYHLH